MSLLRLSLASLVTAILFGPLSGVAIGDVSPPTLLVVDVRVTSPTSATFDLEVARNGAPVSVGVEYGTDTSYGTLVGTVDNPEATDGTLVVSIPIDGLTPGTVYHYRVRAGNSAGQVMSEDRTFTAGDQPPHASGDDFIRRNGNGPFELPVLGNDFDPEQRPLQIISATQGARGAVTILNNGTLIAYELLENGFVGDDTFTYTMTDGSAATDTATVVVHLGRLPVVTEPLFVTGDPVPGAGEAGVPVRPGARFASFGFPAINDQGHVAFSARILSSAGSGAVIIGPKGNSSATVLVAAGDPAPDETGDRLGATFASFLHPLLNDVGDVAFLAVVSGPRVHAGNDVGIWAMEKDGQLRLIAREGDRARGVAGSAIFKSFKSVALADRRDGSDDDGLGTMTIAFVGQLERGRGRIIEADDQGIWRYKEVSPTEPALQLLLREGALFDFHAGDNIPGGIVRSFTALEPQPGAAGHGFGFGLYRHNPPSEDVLARIRFVDGAEAIAEFGTGPDLALRRVAQSNDPQSTHPYARFGIPTQSANGQNAFLATLRDGEDANAENNPEVVFVANDLDTPSVFRVAQEGDPAPSVEGAQFADFHQVVNNGEGSYAFGATVAGPGINLLNNTGIWFHGFPDLVALARESGEAPGISGARFASFLSLAMPADGRVIFKATINDPRTLTRPAGLWFTDDDFALRLAIREGDRIKGERGGRVRTLSILEHVIGSPAQTRSFNGRSELIYRVSFFGGGQAIVKSILPGARN